MIQPKRIKCMQWTFEEFNARLDGLHPLVKKKALEIAKNLVMEKDYTREDAIKKGIMKAEEWFYDLGG
ncbi:hypothetical protein [Christiangramia flava]|nr:hypothetical protein [Christiangramia flava]